MQSFEPNDFSFHVDFFDHISLADNEWSIYYDEFDEEVGVRTIINHFDCS